MTDVMVIGARGPRSLCKSILKPVMSPPAAPEIGTSGGFEDGTSDRVMNADSSQIRRRNEHCRRMMRKASRWLVLSIEAIDQLGSSG